MWVTVICLKIPNQQQDHTVRKMQHEIVNTTARHIKENHLHGLCAPVCLTNPHDGIYTMNITQTNSIIPHLVSCKNWDFDCISMFTEMYAGIIIFAQLFINSIFMCYYYRKWKTLLYMNMCICRRVWEKKSQRFNQLKRQFEQKDDTGKHYFIKISEFLEYKRVPWGAPLLHTFCFKSKEFLVLNFWLMIIHVMTLKMLLKDHWILSNNIINYLKTHFQ